MATAIERITLARRLCPRLAVETEREKEVHNSTVVKGFLDAAVADPLQEPAAEAEILKLLPHHTDAEARAWVLYVFPKGPKKKVDMVTEAFQEENPVARKYPKNVVDPRPGIVRRKWFELFPEDHRFPWWAEILLFLPWRVPKFFLWTHFRKTWFIVWLIVAALVVFGVWRWQSGMLGGKGGGIVVPFSPSGEQLPDGLVPDTPNEQLKKQGQDPWLKVPERKMLPEDNELDHGMFGVPRDKTKGDGGEPWKVPNKK